MQRVVFGGTRDIAIEQAPIPEVRDGEVLVEVAACGICGSDVFAYAGQLSIRTPGTVMGHEASGVIRAVGADVSPTRVGQPVAINPVVACGTCDFCQAGQQNLCRNRGLYGCVAPLPGAYAHFVAVRDDNAIAVDGPAPLEWNALAEPISVGYHAVGVADRLGDLRRVLVVGGGPIGLGVALSARRGGVERLVVSEPLDHRRAVAQRLGLDAVLPDEVSALGEFDVAFDAVGVTPTLTAAIEAVRPQGQVIFVGFGQDVVSMPGHPVEFGERRIAGSAAYLPEEFAAVVAWVSSGNDDLSPLIEDRIGFDDMATVFDAYADRSRVDVKTLLVPASTAA